MGAGIAQVASLAGFETDLHDPFPEALERAWEPCGVGSRRAPSGDGGRRTRSRRRSRELHAAEPIQDLAGCELVIEAAPEDLELKRDSSQS